MNNLRSKIQFYLSRLRFFLQANPHIKGFFFILALIIILPVTIGAALTVQNLRQKASGSDYIKILDATTNEQITQTTNSAVKLQITLPSDWTLAPSQSLKTEEKTLALVKQAYAQSNGSTCLDISVNNGSPVSPGKPYQAVVAIRNDGDTNWTWDSPNPYKLGSQDPQDNLKWSLGRVELQTSPIKPGETVTFRFTVWPPETPGTHSFNWQMLQEGIGWFGSRCYYNVTVAAKPTNTPVPTIVPSVTPRPSATPKPTQLPPDVPTLTSLPSTIPPTEVQTPSATAIPPTQEVNPSESQTPTVHILKEIIIENKDGGTGGTTMPPITGSEIQRVLSEGIKWKLNDLSALETQAEREVQVTLSDGTNSTTLTIQITLKKPTRYNSQSIKQPLSPAERISNLRTTFKITNDIPDDHVQQAVKDDLLKSNILIQGDIIQGDAEVSVEADCTNQQQTNYAFSEYEVFPPLCFTKQDREKAIEYIQTGAESAADFVVDYTRVKQSTQEALSLGTDIQNVRELLKKTGLAGRIQTNRFSGPDSNFDGYAITLIRIKELEQDVQENPDGSGKLTPEQEDARREYLIALRNLWEKQHNILFGLATATAVSVIDRPLRIVGEVAKPIIKPITKKLSEVTSPVTDFLSSFFGTLAEKNITVGLRQISRWDEARSAFTKNMLPVFKPEQREEALGIFERWYTGNYNSSTGKVTLYRFVDLTPETIINIEQNGIRPRGVETAGSIDELLQYLDKGVRRGDQAIANAFREQEAGKDISRAIETYKNDSVVGNPYDIATYWSPLPELPGFSFRQYRITVELNPAKAWREETSQTAISKQKRLAEIFGRPDNVYINGQPRNKDGYERWLESDFEWTVLGEIPVNEIKEIKDLSTDEIIYISDIPFNTYKRSSNISSRAFNNFKNCFKKSLSGSSQCQSFDKNHDGKVDEQDYKLFLQSLEK